MLKDEKIPRLSRRQSEWLFYISLVIVSLIVFLFLGETGYVLFDDSITYMNFHINMEGVMPIYQLFLYVNKLLIGEDSYLDAVIVEQAILAAACIILFIRVIKNRFSLKYWEAYVCYALALLPFTTDMPQAMTTHEILTEGIAYSIFYVFAAALACAVWDKSVKWLGVSWIISLILALIRSQLQILFIVCGVIGVYIAVLKGDSRRKKFLCFVCGLVSCIVICLAGAWCVGRIATGYQKIKSEARREKQVRKNPKTDRLVFTTSQYVSLIFSRGMYEADYEDYLLFEEGQLRDLYLILYEQSEKEQCRYVYAESGLWMWRDIVGGIGSIGSKCFYVQNDFYEENYPDLIWTSNYSAVRNGNQLKIGLGLLRAHFGRFLYHTLMLLPQAFICTVFFQIERIYLLCHIVTLFLYLSAAALMVWAFKNKKVDNSYGGLMFFVICTNLIFIGVISLVFFGQQRYLVYNFGIFYIAYFLLIMQLWKIYGRELALKTWQRITS